MQLYDWIGKHQKKLSLGGGAILIVIALAMLFWDNSGPKTLSEEEAYEQKVAATEARLSGGMAVPKTEESPIMKAYREKQAEHLRYTLIVMIAGGIAFMIYGFLKKEKR